MKIDLGVPQIKWPDGKSKLFVTSARKMEAAWFPETAKDWGSYAWGYWEAAEAVYQVWKIDKVKTLHRDHLIFPYVFLCRHYVELRLKQAIQAASRLVDGKTTEECKHRIDLLWQALKPAIQQIFPQATTGELKHVGKLIMEFSKRDKFAAEFRFPTSLAGKRYLEDLEWMDVENFRSTMQQLSFYLDGTIEGISEHRNNAGDY